VETLEVTSEGNRVITFINDRALSRPVYQRRGITSQPNPVLTW
jgi:hypothetical protein